MPDQDNWTNDPCYISYCASNPWTGERPAFIMPDGSTMSFAPDYSAMSLSAAGNPSVHVELSLDPSQIANTVSFAGSLVQLGQVVGLGIDLAIEIAGRVGIAMKVGDFVDGVVGSAGSACTSPAEIAQMDLQGSCGFSPGFDNPSTFM